MNRQRKILITVIYNDLGIIVDTKAEEIDLSANLQQTCNQLATDCISRQQAIDAVSYSIELCNKALDSITLVGRDRYAVEVERNSLLKLKDDIKLLPTAQPEIIRCGECKHWREDHTCGEHSLVSPMMAYEFCSRAERRQDEHIN